MVVLPIRSDANALNFTKNPAQEHYRLLKNREIEMYKTTMVNRNKNQTGNVHYRIQWILSAFAYALLLSCTCFLYMYFTYEIVLHTHIIITFILLYIGIPIIPCLLLQITRNMFTPKSWRWVASTCILSYILTLIGVIFSEFFSLYAYDSSLHVIFSIVKVMVSPDISWFDFWTDFRKLWGLFGIPTAIYTTGLTIRIHNRSQPGRADIRR